MDTPFAAALFTVFYIAGPLFLLMQFCSQIDFMGYARWVIISILYFIVLTTCGSSIIVYLSTPSEIRSENDRTKEQYQAQQKIINIEKKIRENSRHIVKSEMDKHITKVALELTKEEKLKNASDIYNKSKYKDKDRDYMNNYFNNINDYENLPFYKKDNIYEYEVDGVKVVSAVAFYVKKIENIAIDDKNACSKQEVYMIYGNTIYTTEDDFTTNNKSDTLSTLFNKKESVINRAKAIAIRHNHLDQLENHLKAIACGNNVKFYDEENKPVDLNSSALRMAVRKILSKIEQ